MRQTTAGAAEQRSALNKILPGCVLAVLCNLFLLPAVSEAQTDTVRITPVSQTVPCNRIVDVPVRASRFRSLLSLQGSISWDTAALRFDSVSSFGPTALSLSLANFGQTQTASGRIFVSWNDPVLRGVTLPDSSTLFTLRFTIRSERASTTSLTVGGDPVPLEVMDTSYQTLPVAGGSGTVSLQFRIPGFNPFADTTRICGTSVTLDAGADYTQYTWSNGNVGRRAAINTNGFYTLSVRNELGCTAQDQTLVSLVTADILQSDTTLCRGSDLRLEAVSSAVWQYLWTPSGAVKSSVNLTPTATTTYRLQVTDGITTCQDSVQVTISTVDTALAVTGPLTYCATLDSLVLRAAQAAGYQWLRDGRVLSGASAATLRPDTSGAYRAVVRNTLGCTDSTRSVTVTINPLPRTRLSSPGDSLICEGGTRTLIASGGDTYRWYRNDSLLANVTRDTLTASSAGRYAVEALSTAGCLRRADTVIALVLLKRAQLDFSFSGVCVDVPVKFTNQSTTPAQGIVSWRWTFGNGDTSRLASPENIYLTPGSYRVTLRYANARCPAHLDTVSRPLTLIRERSFRFPDQVAVKGIPKTVYGRDTATAWTWRPTTGLSATNIYNPQATLLQNQQFVIQATLPNRCLVYDTLLVKVAANTAIHVPKAFSPNGDGQNDRLFPVLVGINYLRYFRVYNRWGVLVYEARTSGSNIGWDGIYRGQPQPMETYMWVAEAVDVLGKTLKAGGNSILLR
jgi:gliding motility-associated-like protein